MFSTTQRTSTGRVPDVFRLVSRQLHGQKRQSGNRKGFQGPEGHGEKIWIFCHRRTQQIIYSFSEKLEQFHALKQLPFNGKKSKPAGLRKDYWSQLARIDVGEGQGGVGRSIYAKLRELKHLHEVSWGDEIRYKTTDEFTARQRREVNAAEANGNEFRPARNKKERGAALNAQKQNAVADLAAILAGQGRGNLVAAQGEDGASTLSSVTVHWANDQDKNYAETWSSNVTHGLLETPTYVGGTAEPAPPKAPEATTA